MTSTSTAPSKWKTGLKIASDKAWKVSDYLGGKMNNVSEKIGSEAFYPQPLASEVEKCSRILRGFTTNSEELEVETTRDGTKKKQKVLVKIPTSLLQNAQGLAIYTVFRTGLGLSAASGSGVVISRNQDGSWGTPSGILIHTIGFGFLAGADIYDVVLILRNKKAVNAFANPKISIGAELTVVAGPVGAGAMVDTGYELAPVLSYVKSRGLYGGLQMDGNIIIERNDENARFYHRKIRAKDILEGGIARPLDADLLVATIESAEGRHIEPTAQTKRAMAPAPLSPLEQAAEREREQRRSVDSARSSASAPTTMRRMPPPPIPARRQRASVDFVSANTNSEANASTVSIPLHTPPHDGELVPVDLHEEKEKEKETEALDTKYSPPAYRPSTPPASA